MGFYEVPANVEVKRNQWRVGQHQPLGLLQQRPAPAQVGFGRGLLEQRMKELIPGLDFGLCEGVG